MKIKSHCKDCGIKIGRYSIRCNRCANKKKGLVYSIKYKGKGNPFFGKQHTKKTKEKNKLAHLGNHKEKCCCPFCKAKRGEFKREGHPNFGKPCFIKTKNKISTTLKKYFETHSTWNKNISQSKEHKRNISLSKGGTGIPHENEKYPEKFNSKLKNKIKKRDNYQCQICSMSQVGHYIIYGRDIEVHHIDYNKDNCKEDNLITLCKHCNNKVNLNRNYWKNSLGG